MSDPQRFTILLAEDDPGHARLIEKNLRRASITNDIVQAHDGQEAADYIFGNNNSSRLLVLLDLNMPVLDGYQVLERIKSDKRTRRIPVIVLTTTDDPREEARCYELGCNVYIIKPVDYEQFAETIRKLGLFITVVVIPAGDKV